MEGGHWKAWSAESGSPAAADREPLAHSIRLHPRNRGGAATEYEGQVAQQRTAGTSNKRAQRDEKAAGAADQRPRSPSLVHRPGGGHSRIEFDLAKRALITCHVLLED